MLTRLLVAVNVAAFLWEELTGALRDNVTLVLHGALWGPLVSRGEWWRVVTGAFLHGSVTHILFNMLALWQVGRLAEILYGTWRYALIYAIALAGGGWAVLHYNYDTPTIGASGAIFGLFGALLAAGLRLGSRGRDLVRQTVPIIALNLGLGFVIPNISIAGHVGGLVAGTLAGLVLFNVAGPARAAAPPAAAASPADDVIEGEVLAREDRPAPRDPSSP